MEREESAEEEDEATEDEAAEACASKASMHATPTMETMPMSCQTTAGRFSDGFPSQQERARVSFSGRNKPESSAPSAHPAESQGSLACAPDLERSFSELLQKLAEVHEQALEELRIENSILREAFGGDSPRSLSKASERALYESEMQSLEKSPSNMTDWSLKTLTETNPSQPAKPLRRVTSMESAQAGSGWGSCDSEKRRTAGVLSQAKSSRGSQFSAATNVVYAMKQASSFGSRGPSREPSPRRNSKASRIAPFNQNAKIGSPDRVSIHRPSMTAILPHGMQQPDDTADGLLVPGVVINDELQFQGKALRLLPGALQAIARRRGPGQAGVVGLPPGQPILLPSGGRTSVSSVSCAERSGPRWSASSEMSTVTLQSAMPSAQPQAMEDAVGPLGKMLLEENELAQKVEIMRQLCDSDVKLTFRLWANYVQHLNKVVKFVPFDTWTTDNYSQSALHLSRTQPSVVHTMSRLSQVMAHEDSTRSELECCEVTKRKPHRCIMRPGAPARVAWDLLGAVLLFYDVILIPMSVFITKRSSFETGMDWFTLMFWTCDMAASCLTGYIYQGVTVLDPVLIMRNYLKTWFVIDLIIVGPDWGFTIYEIASGVNVGSGGNSSKLLRSLRVLRMFRMLRLVKLKRVLVMIRDRIDSENLFILLSIIKMMTMMLLVNHFLASIWYGIGDLCRSFDLANWIDEHNFSHKPLGDRYAVAYHWSLTQFSPASMDVQPHNVWERIYAITVLVCGLVLFSSFVSSVTAHITQVRNREGDKSKQFWLLRRYLRQHGIQAQLSFRILRYIEYACSEQQNSVPESSIWVLSLLSQQLRNELNYSVSFTSLRVHPFFETTNTVSRVTMMRLSDSAMSLQSLACNDLIVSPGTIVDCMYMVVSGHLLYLHSEEAFLSEDEEISSQVKMHDWFCEPVLWTEWFALGEVSADTESRVVAINKQIFGTLVRQEYTAWKLASHYARQFVRWLSTKPRRQLSDVAASEEMIPITNGFVEGYFNNRRESRTSTSSNMSTLHQELPRKSTFQNLRGMSFKERRTSESRKDSIVGVGSPARSDSRCSLPSQFSSLDAKSNRNRAQPIT